MRILVTGGTGFLGRRLVSRLLNDRYDIHLLVRRRGACDFEANKHTCLEAALSQSPEVIIHLATTYNRNGDEDLKQIDSNLEIPLEITKRLLDSKDNVKVINADSYYSEQANSLKKYSATKKITKLLFQSFSDNFAVANLNFQHIYGENDSPDKLVSKIISSNLKGKQVKLLQPEKRVDFIYVDDAVDRIVNLLKKQEKMPRSGYQEYYVGTGSEITIAEFQSEVLSQLSGNGLNSSAAQPIEHQEWVAKYNYVDGIAQCLQRWK